MGVLFFIEDLIGECDYDAICSHEVDLYLIALGEVGSMVCDRGDVQTEINGCMGSCL